MYHYGLLIILFCSISASIINKPCVNGITIFEKIATENLKSLSAKNSYIEDENNDTEDFVSILKESFIEQLYPDCYTKRKIVYALLAHYESLHNLQASTILDECSWQDLEILSGSKTNVASYLAQKIDRTSTEIGKIIQYRKIIQPTNNIHDLLHQQTIIRELLKEPDLFEFLTEKFEKIQECENILLSFWGAKDIFKSTLNEMQIKLLGQNHIWPLKKIAQWLNKQEILLQLNEMLTFLRSGVLGASSILELKRHSLNLLYLLPSNKNSKQNEQFKMSSNTMYTFGGILCYLFLSNHTNAFSNALRNVIGFKAELDTINYAYKDAMYHITLRLLLQSKLNHVAGYLREVQSIYDYIKMKRPTLMKLIPNFERFNLKCNKEIEELTSLLKSNTFNGQASILSMTSRIIRGYKLIYESKSKLLNILYSVGELDSHLSIARLYKEFENKKIKFCFPYYLVDAQQPTIEIEDFWHPIINKKRVITNSLNIGGSYPRNIVITGPNAGGKSTIMKALIINIILAQSIGIAPARTLHFTPFSKIFTYLNIVDDIVSNKSLFEAAASRAYELLDSITSMPAHEYSLTAIDELFSGTDYYAGQASAYVLIKNLGAKKHNICITPSHFPYLTKLQSEGLSFENYKVCVNARNQPLLYTYKLEKGISDQIITFNLLKERGFTQNFIEEAKIIFEHLKAK